ncbi:glycosyltransferase [Candidatus Methylacidiphilum infernorum]|nr:glycosyltransferase [Candidatus Methylacidiphilum infernorum]
MEHGEKTKEKRRIVIVLGMHRSGTSALSRSLMALGLSLGQSLLDPQPDNPMGFWEDRQIVAINEEVLAASGSSWDSFAPPDLSLKEAKMVSLLRKAEELIEQKLKEKNFAFKDPRTIRLLPFWHTVFEKKEISPSYLLVIRNPLAVGYSLFRRNQFPLVKSFCLWLSHNVLPWPLYVPYLKAVVDYDRFLDQPEKELQRIAGVFSLPYDDQAVLVLKRNFLKQEYRHARFTDMDLERHQAAFYPLVESWKLFKAMATFSPIPREAKAQMDSLSKSFSAFQQLLSLFDFYNESKKKELAELYDREKKLGEELEEKKLEIRELKEKLKKNHFVNRANKEFIAKIFRDLAYSSPGKKKIWNRGKKEVDPEKEMAVKFMESGLFDPGYYWSCYPDVKKAGADPLLHYVRHGWKEGKNPNPYFDSAYYLEKNPEVKAAGVNPLLHFIENGWKEGRNPHPDFDLDLYLETQPEVRLSGVNPLKHFLESVKSLEGGTAPGQGTPERGQYLKILRSSLFDRAYYLGQYPDVQEAGIDPLLHYIRHGWKEGRNPNPYFDSAYYLEKNPEVKAAGVNPLLHFIENGWKEGRNPHPDFDLDLYLETQPELRLSGVNPLKHFLESVKSLEGGTAPGQGTPERGQYLKILRSSLFDKAYYLGQYPDVQEAGIDPLLHYIRHGWKEGRNPNPYFNSAYYLEKNPDVKAAGVNPLLHFIENGWKEGRNPHPDFDLRSYLERYPDVKQAQVNPLWHYLHYGQKENRITKGKSTPPWEISPSMAPRKKALVFNDYLLVPDRRGGDFRTFQIIKIIRELGWEVNLAVLNDRENHGKVLQEDNLDIEFKHYEGILFEAGVKEILLGEEKIKTFLSRQGQEISVAYVFSPTVAYHFIPLIRSYAVNAKLIYDPVDLAFIRLERKAALSKDPLVIEEAKQAKIIDTTNFVASDAIVAITEEEKEKILELSLQSRVEVVPNIHEVHKPKSPWENRKSILFLGYFGHEPNVDGLSYFILEMWESIREHIPGCSFEIVGSFLKEYVPEELLNRPGIQPVGYVPDLVPCFEKARVFVAPLRFGAGMKGKIGMAMASGLPVVTTSIGAEGMKLENGKNAFICDDKEEFIQAVVRLYKEKELWERLSQAALEHVESRYSKAVVKETLKKLFSFHCL